MTANNQELLESTRNRIHRHCLLCGPASLLGFHIAFQVRGESEVEAIVSGLDALEGYPGTLHGGVIASLLDAAMTNCLFARGVTGLTAHLEVRYREPVAVGKPIHLRAWLTKTIRPLYILVAELKQEDRLKARADAKFMEQENICKPK